MATEQTPTGDGRVLGRGAVAPLLLIVVFGAVAAIPEPMTWPARVAVALAVVAVLALALRRSWHRPGLTVARSERTKAGAVPAIVWALLIATVVTIQLAHFFAEPRSIYPTLSSLAEEPLTFYPVRAAAISVWIWLGWYLVDR